MSRPSFSDKCRKCGQWVVVAFDAEKIEHSNADECIKALGEALDELREELRRDKETP